MNKEWPRYEHLHLVGHCWNVQLTQVNIDHFSVLMWYYPVIKNKIWQVSSLRHILPVLLRLDTLLVKWKHCCVIYMIALKNSKEFIQLNVIAIMVTKLLMTVWSKDRGNCQIKLKNHQWNGWFVLLMTPTHII